MSNDYHIHGSYNKYGVYVHDPNRDSKNREYEEREYRVNNHHSAPDTTVAEFLRELSKREKEMERDYGVDWRFRTHKVKGETIITARHFGLHLVKNGYKIIEEVREAAWRRGYDVSPFLHAEPYDFFRPGDGWTEIIITLIPRGPQDTVFPLHKEYRWC